NCTSSGLTTVTVTATEADNDPVQQTIVVSATAISVPEGGSTTFGVHLGTQPTANVWVTCAAGTGDADITVSTGALTFSSANFNVNHNVTVAAAEDADNTHRTRQINCTSTGVPTVTVTATEA